MYFLKALLQTVAIALFLILTAKTNSSNELMGLLHTRQYYKEISIPLKSTKVSQRDHISPYGINS